MKVLIKIVLMKWDSRINPRSEFTMEQFNYILQKCILIKLSKHSNHIQSLSLFVLLHFQRLWWSNFRGEKVPDMYWEKRNGELASGDDISVFVVDVSKIRSFLSNPDWFFVLSIIFAFKTEFFLRNKNHLNIHSNMMK